MAALYKTRRFITSGTKTSVSQAFYNNDFINPEEAQVPYYSMEIPTIVVTAGTKDYYGQDPRSIVTNSGKPVLRVQFLSGGTNVSVAGVGITQVLTKLRYDVYELYNKDQITQSTELDSSGTKGSTEERLANAVTQKNKLAGGGNTVRVPESLYGQGLTNSDKNYIQGFVDTPTFTQTVRSVPFAGDSGSFDLYLPENLKVQGNIQEPFFEDKAQYFFDVYFSFETELDNSGVTNYYTIQDGIITDSAPPTEIPLNTKSGATTINQGPFSGVNVSGYYFTYFVTPDKPSLVFPYPPDVLTSSTLNMFWENGEAADEYLVQVCYDTGNTMFQNQFNYAEDVYNYEVPKDENSKSQAVQRSDKLFSDTSTRTFKFNVNQTNVPFIYRVGNVKSLKNIFGVQQQVCTFSDTYMSVYTGGTIADNVFVQSSSPYVTGTTTYSKAVYISGQDFV